MRLTHCVSSSWLASRPTPAAGRGATLWRLVLVAALAGGCQDPVRQEQIDKLGPEAPGVLPGPLHRPGQPCLLCHELAGLAPRFTAAGTVFQTPAKQQPVGGIQVQLIDAARRWFVAYTNCAGNFFVMPQEFEPVMPLWVSLSGQSLHIDMESPMNKDGDCGTCHQGTKSPSSAGYVFLADDAPPSEPAPTSACGGSLP